VHSGILIALRKYLMFAKPWQQVLIGALLVAVGSVLLSSGLLIGLAVVFFGLLVCWQILSARPPGVTTPSDED
jgi:hypothetical protein